MFKRLICYVFGHKWGGYSFLAIPHMRWVKCVLKCDRCKRRYYAHYASLVEYKE